MTLGFLLLSAAGLGAILFAPRLGLLSRWRLRQRRRGRTLFEDALKHLFVFSLNNQQATSESLSGSLRISGRRLVNLIARMEAGGLIHSTGGHLRLREEGRRRALQVVRAHRLWERYLADELRTPLAKLHSSAERAEHTLTTERLDALEAHLGHPLRDPHGDPIPQADGSLAPLLAVPLNDWPINEKAEIVHIEDEPEYVLRQILQFGLKPGTRLHVLEHLPETITISDGERQLRLTPVLAANIHVRAAPTLAARPSGTLPLNELPNSQQAEVVDIDPEYRGLGRRRLLDLGLTPSAKVVPELATAFGDPRAYRVRGTLVALRNDQAQHVWVRPILEEALRN